MRCRDCNSEMINFSIGQFVRLMCPVCNSSLRGYKNFEVWRNFVGLVVMLQYIKQLNRSRKVDKYVNGDQRRRDVDGNLANGNNYLYKQPIRRCL